jgi:YceI-like protein
MSDPATWVLQAQDLASGASRLELYTYKEGMLSRVAHDLCLRAEGATLSFAEGGALEVAVEVASLRVQGQVKRGHVKALSAKDHAEIEKNMQSSAVLDAKRFAQATYRGTCTLEGARVKVTGELEVRGQRRPLALEGTWRRDGDEALASGEVRFRQSEWGIKPYSALMGAIKVKDELRVSWSLRLRRSQA